MRNRARLLAVLLVALGGRALGAQPSQPSQVEFRAGLSYKSEFRTKAGPQERNFVVTAIAMSWGAPTRRVSYDAVIIPLAVASNNPRSFFEVPCAAEPGTCSQLRARGATELAFGVQPLGFSVRLLQRGRLRWEFQGNSGFVVFQHPVPGPEARRFNFLHSAALAMDVGVTSRSAVSLALARQHASNAGTARSNPGLDAFVLSLGVSRRQSE